MHSGDMGDRSFVFTYPMFQDLEREQNIFTGIAAHASFGANLAYRDETEGVRCLFVSGSYFPVLSLQPALGRLFNPSDDAVVDEPHAVVLAYDYWLSRFAGDPGVLNQTLTLNGQLMTIIGVAPKEFRGTTAGGDRQVFVPITMIRFGRHNFRNFQDRKTYLFYLFASLKPGVTVEQATSAINVPYHHIVNDVEAPLQQHMSEDELASFNSKYSNVKEEVGPFFFQPYRQGNDLDGVSFYVRTAADPGGLLGQIPPSIAKIDPGVPVQEARTLPQQVQQNISPDRMIGILCTVFAVIATILAAVGLYGVLAYVVAQRTKEIGLRMALGAAPAKIHAMVLRQVAWMALIGGILGLAVAVGAGRFTESILFKLNGHDPAVLVLAVVFLTLIALAAGFIPARRASRVDPIKALRYE